ncbi:MAG: hypothetical protein H3C47_06370 [Candidatus Cloacimonetes bacterium]|nr:hypothetical protein [Candidatus Cloacimonadota bacterium]
MYQCRKWNGNWHLFLGNEPVLRDDSELLTLRSGVLLDELCNRLNSHEETLADSQLYCYACDLSRIESNSRHLKFSISSALQRDLFVGSLRQLDKIQSELKGSLKSCFKLYGLQNLPLVYCQDLSVHFSQKIQELGPVERVFLAYFFNVNQHCLLPLWYLLDEISLNQLLESASILCSQDIRPQQIQGEFLKQLVFDFAKKNRSLFQFLALALPPDHR